MNQQMNELLLSVKDPLDLATLLNQYQRIQKLIGQSNTLVLFKNLYETQCIQLLNQMSDSELQENYGDPTPMKEEKIEINLQQQSSHVSPKKYNDKNITKGLSSVQNPQTQRQQMKQEFDASNPENKGTNKDKIQKGSKPSISSYPQPDNFDYSYLDDEQRQLQEAMKRSLLNFHEEDKKNLSSEKKEEDQFQTLTKNLIQSLTEFKGLSQHTESGLKELINFVKNYVQNSQVIEQSNLKNHVDRLRGRRPDKGNLFEYFQVVDSALYHSSPQYRLKKTQLIALLLFLQSSNKKILLQILTGEGKSTTIAALAAIFSISGRSVDIVTTSSLLASRDVQEKKQFYSLMGLEVSHNLQDKQRGEKECYKKHKIVYGTSHKFEADVLFNDYKKRGTRCNRPFDILIVDQVDSLFIDQKGHQTLLGSTYPGFAELAYPMKIIWNKITTSPVYKQGDKVKLALAVGKSETVTAQAKVVLQEVIKDIRKQFNNEIVPEWRMGFIEESLDHWVNSAIKAAFTLKQDVHYTIQNNKIIPIDMKNTGELQHSVHWNNGLHQFLEIKHGLPFTTESMTSNFLSNIGNFDKYTELYGLTGTMGSTKARQFLKITYKAELFKVPPFKERKLIIDPGKVLYNQIDWARHICRRIQQLVNQQRRSVLVICETIQEVERIQKTLRDHVKSKRTQLLTRGDQKIDDKIDICEVILATNLAGRGADLKISEALNEAGGLHVIIGFMPINSRVQMQGRGRAGRIGNNGSSQLIINLMGFCNEFGMQLPQRWLLDHTQLYNVKSLCDARDELEARQMVEDQNQVTELRAKDKVFNIYCTAMNQIPDFQDNEAKRIALEQQWAMFLKRADNLKLPYKQLQAEAMHLCNKLKANSDGYYNPNHHIERGINAICKNNNQDAINFMHKAQQNTGSLPQIIGGLYENCLKINSNKQDSNTINGAVQGLKTVQAKIKARQEMRQGLNLFDAQNQKITNVIHENAQLENREFEARIRQNVSGNISSHQPNNVRANLNHSRPQRSTKVSASKITQVPGEGRILQGISNHIDELVGLYSKLGKGQYVEINWEPISKILDTIDGDEAENKKALEDIAVEGLKLLPKGTIKKKKVSFWKRLGVFLLGVVQIVVGSLIVASTAGALTNFGVTMMMEGAKWCFDSIFRPEQLEDLGKYMSQTAIKYAFALAASGLEGIKQLGTLSRNGVGVMKQGLGTFVDKLITNTGIGFQKAFGINSLGGVATHLISSGLTHLVSKNSQNPAQDISNPMKVIQQHKDRIRSEVKKGAEEEKRLDSSVEKTTDNFSQKIQKFINACISRLDKQLMAELRNLPLRNDHLTIVIRGAMAKELEFTENSQENMKVMELFCLNLEADDLAIKYADMIKLERKIKDCLQKIKTQKNFQQAVDQGILKLITESLILMRDTKKAQMDTQTASFNTRVNTYNQNYQTMTVNNANQEAEAINREQTRVNEIINKYKACFQQQLNPRQILDTIKQNRGIEDGRLKPNVIDSMSFHPYVKEALKNLRYSDSFGRFEEILSAAIFNIVGNHGIKLISNMYASSNGSASRLEKLAEMLNRK